MTNDMTDIDVFLANGNQIEAFRIWWRIRRLWIYPSLATQQRYVPPCDIRLWNTQNILNWLPNNDDNWWWLIKMIKGIKMMAMINSYIYIIICVQTNTHTHTYICTYMYTYIYIYTHIYAYFYLCTRKHTQLVTYNGNTLHLSIYLPGHHRDRFLVRGNWLQLLGFSSSNSQEGND